MHVQCSARHCRSGWCAHGATSQKGYGGLATRGPRLADKRVLRPLGSYTGPGPGAYEAASDALRPVNWGRRCSSSFATACPKAAAAGAVIQESTQHCVSKTCAENMLTRYGENLAWTCARGGALTFAGRPRQPIPHCQLASPPVAELSTLLTLERERHQKQNQNQHQNHHHQQRQQQQQPARLQPQWQARGAVTTINHDSSGFGGHTRTSACAARFLKPTNSNGGRYAWPGSADLSVPGVGSYDLAGFASIAAAAAAKHGAAAHSTTPPFARPLATDRFGVPLNAAPRASTLGVSEQRPGKLLASPIPRPPVSISRQAPHGGVPFGSATVRCLLLRQHDRDMLGSPGPAFYAPVLLPGRRSYRCVTTASGSGLFVSTA